MKDSVHSIEIVPLVGYLDFFGSADDSSASTDSKTLKGKVNFKLNKAIKAKSITVKFNGHSQVHHYVNLSDNQAQHAISSPLLPKFKSKILSKSTVFPPGDHSLLWELDIPNIYPRTFSATKRGTIQYKVEVKISLGINRKPLIASHPIIIRRHLISSMEQITKVQTRTFQNESHEFRYELEVPNIICVDQPYLPIAILFNRPVAYIYTQFIQTEIYRCRNISKAEADMAIMASKKNSTLVGGQTQETFKNGDAGLSKFFKRIQPISLNTIDVELSSIPLLILHDLKTTSLLTPGIESPLVSIYHQLEVTFNFGNQGREEIRAKIPILISSVPDPTPNKQRQSVVVTPEKYVMETRPHKLPVSVKIIDSSIDTTPKKISNRSTLDEPAICSIKNMLEIQKSVKKSVSDQNIKQTMDTLYEKRRSVTPPPVLNRPNMINTQLANAFQTNMSLTSPSTPNRPTLVSSSSSSTENIIYPPLETFSGLHPPPRRARKKEPSIASSEEYDNMAHNRSTLPLPAIPKVNGNGNSRPTSPISMHSLNASNGNYPFMHPTSDYTPPQSPLPPPTTPRTLLRMNQSKSSCTTSSLDSQLSYLSRKRSNSIDIHDDTLDNYSKSITNHYTSADLPPIPPAITRQTRPSIPDIDKEENRKTKMYYEDDSDDEEDEDEDYDFFLQQTFK